ncbi:MAG TPA: PD-(D/E)XK nuclease family protein [Candidatus Binatia bacterium]
MKTVLGPFHPHLEIALVEEIRQHKTENALAPVLILVPSDALRRRLKILLTREYRLSLVNLQLLTFHQLSLRLSAEAQGLNLPTPRDDLFLEETLRQIIRSKRPGTEAFAGIEERVGGCAALWQTLRDLRDGMVEPSLALEAFREGQFSSSAGERTSHLLRLLQTLRLFCKEKGIEDLADLEKRALERAPQSRFLDQFARILYYGFYDLTQVQLDLFHAVVQHYRTTLFFPLLQTEPSHEGWIFAERFYQSYIQGRSGTTAVTNFAIQPPAEDALPPTFRLFDQSAERRYAPLPKIWRCQIVNAFGLHDEVGAAAKEILRLVADDGMAFTEIGVVARSLEGYGPAIKEVFRNHAIPIAGVIEEPLAQFPLTKSVILLLNLRAKDYLRTHVIDLVSSPYFRLDAAAMETGRPRPDMWDLATRELAICKGVREWHRLKAYTSRELLLSQVSHDDEPRVIRIAAAQIRGLANVFNEILMDLNALPAEASWRHYVDAWKAILQKYLGIADHGVTDSMDSETLLRDEILSILDRMAGLDLVRTSVSLSDFSQTFQHWLERSTVAGTPLNAAGVAVLNATAARGQSFRAIFILGLNEGVFPRTIREDAFMRDQDREILERDLGFKVNSKLGGFDEEKLVFTLLVNATKERLFCLFQRSDESGRVLAPSWYLAELRRALEDYPAHLEESTIPRSIIDKNNIEPFHRNDLLLAEELAVSLSLADRDPTPLIEAFDLSPAIYKQGRQVVERLDLSSATLDAFDGVVSPLSDYWRYLSRNGPSPTALETYSRCPFQFFAHHVLGLERLERPEDVIGLSPAQFGELGHLILKLTYQELIDRGYFSGAAPGLDVAATLKTIARQAFAEYASTNPIGYPLAWEIFQEGLTKLLDQVIARDLQEISVSGYRPAGVEVAVKGQFETTWPEPLNGMPIRGRIDRIDRHLTKNRLRIVDYKFKLGGSLPAEDKDLYRAALRGEKLQPPFYVLLGRGLMPPRKPQRTVPEVEASFYYIGSGWMDEPLVTTGFGSEGLAGKLGDEIRNTISYLAQGIKSGRFFIRAGEYCRHCDVAAICRKNHPPSLWRAENDPITAPHRQLHEKDPKKL